MTVCYRSRATVGKQAFLTLTLMKALPGYREHLTNFPSLLWPVF